MLIYNKNNIEIYSITSYQDSSKLGFDTYWCISLYNEWFDIHKNRNEDFLFIFNKNLTDDNINSKLCLTIKINDGYCEITNKYNETYKPNSDEERHCLNILGKDAVEFITNYININYND